MVRDHRAKQVKNLESLIFVATTILLVMPLALSSHGGQEPNIGITKVESFSPDSSACQDEAIATDGNDIWLIEIGGQAYDFCRIDFTDGSVLETGSISGWDARGADWYAEQGLVGGEYSRNSLQDIEDSSGDGELAFQNEIVTGPNVGDQATHKTAGNEYGYVSDGSITYKYDLSDGGQINSFNTGTKNIEASESGFLFVFKDSSGVIEIRDASNYDLLSTYQTNVYDLYSYVGLALTPNEEYLLIVDTSHTVHKYELSGLHDDSSSVSICDSRGLANQCISNQTHSISGEKFDITSVFKSRETAVFKALDQKSTLNITNSSIISGFWKGDFEIRTERPRLVSGAVFRPENGRIKIG